MACFLPSGYKVYCVFERSRYKVYELSETYPGIQIGKRQLAQCRGTRFISDQKFIRVHIVVSGIVRVSGCRSKL